MLLKHLPASSLVDHIVDTVRSDAGVIVDNVLPTGMVDGLLTELLPHVERSVPGQDAFSGTGTTRTGGLIARSSAARYVALHPLAIATANAFLAPWCERIQLQLAQVIRLLPGQGEQPLHQDRLIWGDIWTGPVAAIEPQFNTMWALTPFTAENGATRIVPGSHAWEAGRSALAGEIVQAEMSRGSVLFYTGSVLHGGGGNCSDEVRIGLDINYCLSWLRQEENQYLSCPPTVARTLAPDLQELLGYTIGRLGLGYFTSLDSPDVKAPEEALGRLPRKQLSYDGPVGQGYNGVRAHEQ